MNRPTAAPPEPAPADDAASIERLDALLAALPPALEPLDPGALDGYLCGVLLQPRPVPEAAWLPHVFDADGRPLPRALPPAAAGAIGAIADIARQRHAALDRAIARRDWFDPWILEASGDGDVDAGDDTTPVAAAVRPWVIGFATALEAHPALLAALQAGRHGLVEPLALVYLHFDADDLDEIEPELQAAIESIEPPADLAEAVQDLVRAVMLIADETRPQRRPETRARARPTGERPTPQPSTTQRPTGSRPAGPRRPPRR